MANAKEARPCAVCGKSFSTRDLVPGIAVRDVIANEILREHSDWSLDKFICRADLNRFRSTYVHNLLESEWTVGERLADRIATFGGSWTFLICFAVFLALWIGFNSVVLYSRPPDPYPYILLNLILSCLAAIQAPVIMMSQNRQEAKDRLRSQHDYQVNLKAELEIRHLHEKVDHLLSHQWERLAQIQEIQLELLSELSRKR